MHPLYHLVPAAVCLLAGIMMVLTIATDLRAGTLHWRDRETCFGGSITLLCFAAGLVSLLGVFTR